MSKIYGFRKDKEVVKSGFVLEDKESGKIMYSADYVKKPLLGAATVVFKNGITGNSEEHKVGHTITTETDYPNMGLTPEIFMTTRSQTYFKIDGTKIWDFLRDRGVYITPTIESKLKVFFNVSHNGKQIARITETYPSKVIIGNNANFDVECEDEDIAMAFLVTFTLAKTNSQTAQSMV